MAQPFKARLTTIKNAAEERGHGRGAQQIGLSELPGGKGAVWFQEAVWTGNFCLCFNAQKLKTEREGEVPKRAQGGAGK